MIDSHCHLDDEAFAQDRGEVLRRAATRGVTDIVVPAVAEGGWAAIRKLGSDSWPRCHAALGIHPVALPSMHPDDDGAVIDRLREALERDRPVAVGECGLDTTIPVEAAPIERQKRVLTAQLALASRYHLPVILHARGPGCYAQLLDFLSAATLPEWGGALHSYGGGPELLRKFLALPLCFGFAGPATYSNARKVRSSIALVPGDRLLAETDAPDQTPEPHRPGRSEPGYVVEVIHGLAQARGEPVEVVAAQTAANARRLFDLPPEASRSDSCRK